MTKREFYAKALLYAMPVAATQHWQAKIPEEEKFEKIVSSSAALAYRLTLALESAMFIYDVEDADPQRPADYLPSTHDLLRKNGTPNNN